MVLSSLLGKRPSFHVDPNHWKDQLLIQYQWCQPRSLSLCLFCQSKHECSADLDVISALPAAGQSRSQ
ncbi:hypothetical protein CH063_13226 [Colletotrichum higginsianum]|uniref:Uncharacterized protein n=1 Tax=Colletotrichum higginsianum (strain IMI 349063) TaxID=759273 RepID=H1VTK2_COLHI|nr:hypothetical protein CH063_13226 [Colletotrichum higginsianum]